MLILTGILEVSCRGSIFWTYSFVSFLPILLYDATPYKVEEDSLGCRFDMMFSYKSRI